MSTAKDLKKLIRDKERNGWTVLPTNGGHYKWIYNENGRFFFSTSSPSDCFHLKKIKNDIKNIEENTGRYKNAI